MSLLKKIFLKNKFILLDLLWWLKLTRFQIKYGIRFYKYSYIWEAVVITFEKASQIVINGPATFGRYSELNIIGAIGKVIIEPGLTTRSFCKFRIENGFLKIGKNVFFNNNCSVNCFDEIEIGDNVIFGESVHIYDHNHKIDTTDGIIAVSHNEFTSSKITIGDNTWIASNVTILKGVSIGKNCVIGAGCIIHKSVPDNTIVKVYQNLNYETIA